MKRTVLPLLFIALLTGCGGAAKNPGIGGVAVGGSKIPYAKAVPEKPGYVYSPYTSNTVHVDVKGFPRGTQVKDPFTGNIFLVP